MKDRVTVRSAMLRNMFLLIAAFATLVALGCWDNRREMQRVLEKGYATSAQIVGAHFERLSPITLDGWRPRFLEQEVSVDLQWRGQDGKSYMHSKVPVSERFASTIVNGDQVKLIGVPVKVLDDDTAVPVITFDAAARLDSLKGWLTASSLIALAGCVALAAMGAWQRRMAGLASGRAAEMRPVRIPPQRTLIGIVALTVGAFLTYSAWSAGTDGGDESSSVEMTVQVNAVTANPYAVQLAWKDKQGGVHHYGPLPISERFWKEITRDGQLVVHETRVRMAGGDLMTRPVIVADAPGKQWQTQAVLGVGLLMMAIGVGCLLSAVRAMRRF